MSRGIAIPARTENGKLVVLDEESQLRKVIQLGLLDGSSNNPFADDVGTPERVFAVDDPSARAQATLAIRRNFRRLASSGRARLDSLRFDPVDGDGVQRVAIVYTDIVNGETIPIVKAFGVGA